MTCLIAACNDKQAVVAADRLIVSGSTINAYRRKVFKRGYVVIGLAGSLGACQAVEYNWITPEHGKKPVDEIAWRMARSMFEIANAAPGDHKGFDAVMAWGNQIYDLGGGSITNRTLVGVATGGAGWQIALGAWEGLSLWSSHLDLSLRMGAAMRIVARNMTNVGPEVDMEWTSIG